MRIVTQHFLPLCLPILLGIPLRSQQATPQIKGGGGLRVAGRLLEFSPSEGVAGPPQGGVHQNVLRLKGTLRGAKGELLELELQFTEGGKVYRMNLFRKTGDQEVERWAATLKTQVKVLALDGRIGGTVRLRLTGPLSGIVDGLGRQDAWDGELWFTLQSWPKR
ncbi:MAG: hypothetical protein HYZ13_12395 [Acidobacteria bacterium]|nr:hypothetical protein [Acidobacteriota bacterium]